jgi:hypothetical protein
MVSRRSTEAAQPQAGLPVSEVVGVTVDEAIRRGWIKLENDTVRVPSSASPTKQELSQSYDRLTATDVRGALIMAGADPEKLLRLFNTQFDVKAREPIRRRLVIKAKKPQKAFQKAARELVIAGLAKHETEATQMLERMQQDKAKR